LPHPCYFIKLHAFIVVSEWRFAAGLQARMRHPGSMVNIYTCISSGYGLCATLVDGRRAVRAPLPFWCMMNNFLKKNKMNASVYLFGPILALETGQPSTHGALVQL
jgi:hypothetical protein